MSSLTELQPENLNYLQINKFLLSLRKLPKFQFFVQGVRFPGITVGVAPAPGPFQTIQVPGDHAKFETLDVTFKVDEYLESWLSIFDWMYSIGRVESSDGLLALVQKPKLTGQGPQVDATLSFLDKNEVATCRFEFEDMFPIRLSGWDNTTTVIETTYATATVSFMYTLYKPYRILPLNQEA